MATLKYDQCVCGSREHIGFDESGQLACNSVDELAGNVEYRSLPYEEEERAAAPNA